jgi:hypothetical protein
MLSHIFCFGVGSRLSHTIRHTLSFGVSEVLSRYNEILPRVELSGPTSFAPLIRKSVEIVRAGRVFLFAVACGCLRVCHRLTLLKSHKYINREGLSHPGYFDRRRSRQCRRNVSGDRRGVQLSALDCRNRNRVRGRETNWFRF